MVLSECERMLFGVESDGRFQAMPGSRFIKADPSLRAVFLLWLEKV